MKRFWIRFPAIQATTISYSLFSSQALVIERRPTYPSSNSASRALFSSRVGSTEEDTAEDADGELLHTHMSYATEYHAPVMCEECIHALLGCSRNQARKKGEGDGKPLVFVDGTLGGGGHSAALLEKLGPGDILFGCDVDSDALTSIREIEGIYG